MRVGAVLSCFLTINLYAQADWIPLEPQNRGNTTKVNSAQPQSIPAIQLFEKVKIIHQLLDKTGAEDEADDDGKKNWFIIENTER